MKLWISGELGKEVGRDFATSMLKVEEAVNSRIANKKYDIPLSSWDVLAIVRDDDAFEERTRYSKKKRDMDFRLKVDLAEFLKGDQLQRELMIYRMLCRSLALLRKKGICGQGMDQLESDLTAVAKEHGWAC